jgi:hypothetical protein
MDARRLEAAEKQLEHWGDLVVLYGAAGAIAALIAAGIGPLHPEFAAVPVGVALVSFVLSAVILLCRRELIEHLARDPSAHAMPAVRRFAFRLNRAESRIKTAHQLLDLVHQAQVPQLARFHLQDRVLAHADDLTDVARALLLLETRISASSLVEVHYLLVRAVESPLYNPTADQRELSAALLRIRAGIGMASDAVEV